MSDEHSVKNYIRELESDLSVIREMAELYRTVENPSGFLDRGMDDLLCEFIEDFAQRIDAQRIDAQKELNKPLEVLCEE